MLVIIDIRDVDLADPMRGIVSIDFGKRSDLKAPITWNPQAGHHFRSHRKLTGQRVTKAPHVSKVFVVSGRLLQGLNQGSHEQSKNATIQSPLCGPVVIPFAEHVVHVRVHKRVKQTRWHITLIGQDIAVV